ncbi:hypothetical protein [Celeribacter indicus]|uniref:Uncharacterized protein n=1 Tax=Celeribacter indicus TaxID=1208324 RepID=A0A0B5E9P9_9RHOB|nr:hypothetical protein [Celeribacter indicus]AJE49072.1 hypothetical protein P73_4357 [Celeribacter indicus]SDW45190.1 hypothetical protein SAMN05443573_103282 [Celeribacter indicus]
MSAPDTNTKKQARRHWPPLLAFLLVVCFGVGIILYWTMEETATAPETEQTAPAMQPPSAEEMNEGDVDAPPSAPQTEITPDPVNPGLDE